MSEAQKKVDFIIAWYNMERIKFGFVKQIMLAKTWIEICTKNEEYEMAAALQREKEKVIKHYLQQKRANRTWKQKLWYWWIKAKRKLRKKGL